MIFHNRRSETFPERFGGYNEIKHKSKGENDQKTIFFKLEKTDEWLWEFFHSAPGSASNFHVVKGRRLTTRLFWQEGWGYRWSATGHNLIQRSQSLWSLLICICDRFTGLFQVGDFYNVHAGWELRTGVPALLHKEPRPQPAKPTAHTNLIPRTTYKMVVPLDNLQKQGWPVLHGLGEDLKEVALVVEINQDFQFLEKKQHDLGNWKRSEMTGGRSPPPSPPSAHL